MLLGGEVVCAIACMDVIHAAFITSYIKSHAIEVRRTCMYTCTHQIATTSLQLRMHVRKCIYHRRTHYRGLLCVFGGIQSKFLYTYSDCTLLINKNEKASCFQSSYLV